jgi:hypothetical protein
MNDDDFDPNEVRLSKRMAFIFAGCALTGAALPFILFLMSR